MRIPVYVAIAQWVLLLSLGVLVALMFRQLGRHLSVSRPAAEHGPRAGTPAAVIEYTRLDGGGEEVLRPGDGRAALVAFADPTCPSCEELVAALNRAHAEGELANVRPLLLVSEPPAYLRISEPFRDTRLPLGRVLSEGTLAAYRVSATPLLVAIDGTGVVRAAGPATRRANVQAFLAACLLPSPGGGTLPTVPATPEAAGSRMMPATAAEER